MTMTAWILLIGFVLIWLFLLYFFIYLIRAIIKIIKENSNKPLSKTKIPITAKHYLNKIEIQELLLSQENTKYDPEIYIINNKDLHDVFKGILETYKCYPIYCNLSEKNIEYQPTTIELMNDGSYEMEWTQEARMCYYVRCSKKFLSYNDLYDFCFYYGRCRGISIIN